MISFVNKSAFDPFGHQVKSRLAGPPNYESLQALRNGHHRLAREKAPEADLKRQYSGSLKAGFVITLSFLILLFQLARNFVVATAKMKPAEVAITVEDIPMTQQFHRPPPPPRPSVPLPTEQESVPEDVTIASTEFDLTNIPPPPPMPEDDDDSSLFVAYDEPPAIIGGMAALHEHLHYPERARKMGVEGKVALRILVSKEGVCKKVEVLNASISGLGFEESAIAAVQRVKWKPAKQRDRNIQTWVAMPVHFKLTSH
jgi:protein TonB